MKALVKKERAPGLWMEDVPFPKIKDNEVLIKTLKTSICGTDVHIYKWDAWAQKRVPTPLIIGHEFMGEIAACGSEVKHLRVGQRVSAEGHLTCGQCVNCLKDLKHLCTDVLGLGYDCSGCFAEYFPIPAENVFPLPEFVGDDLAAIFDPFGNAVHTAMSFNLKNEDVLITGAGPIGIMAAMIARHQGARHIVVTDIIDYRLGLAKQMGATCVVDASKENLKHVMKELKIEQGFTVGLEMSGNGQAFHTMLETMLHGGNIALLGILPLGVAIDWDLVIFKMLQIKGIYGREIFKTWHQMTNLIEDNLNLAPIITHRFPVDDFQKGFDAMLSGHCGKVILDWS
ncbi:L-threonine 3-dehydrogenase [Chlamydiales bacterium STE3]|nr:L-threonine 3-dehydrogenase [Chlamydiales bacterium STE3]